MLCQSEASTKLGPFYFRLGDTITPLDVSTVANRNRDANLDWQARDEIRAVG